jgi:hypothetical protein
VHQWQLAKTNQALWLTRDYLYGQGILEQTDPTDISG